MKVKIHETPVRISAETLRLLCEEAKKAYEEVGNRDTSEGRSLFSQWNNMQKFYDRTFSGLTTEPVLNVEGYAEPDVCARIYYTPSLTSLTKQFRKSVVPVNEGNVFLFFDLKAAEFFLSCYFAGQLSVVEPYMKGEDPYSALASHFPAGTERSVYKTALIASLYGGTAYSTAKRLGCTEAYAERLLMSVARATPKLQNFKARVAYKARTDGFYRYPTNLQQTEFNKVPYKVLKYTKEVGFNPNLALSAYTQSALGAWMQNLVHNLQPYSKGTLLTVFDSCLIEVSPNDLETVKNKIKEFIYPFQTSGIRSGKTFYEVYANEN